MDDVVCGVLMYWIVSNLLHVSSFYEMIWCVKIGFHVLWVEKVFIIRLIAKTLRANQSVCINVVKHLKENDDFKVYFIPNNVNRHYNNIQIYISLN